MCAGKKRPLVGGDSMSSNEVELGKKKKQDLYNGEAIDILLSTPAAKRGATKKVLPRSQSSSVFNPAAVGAANAKAAVDRRELSATRSLRARLSGSDGWRLGLGKEAVERRGSGRVKNGGKNSSLPSVDTNSHSYHVQNSPLSKSRAHYYQEHYM